MTEQRVCEQRATELSAVEARRLRLAAQLVHGSELGPAELVRRGVAFQGQDLPAVLRALAVRARPGTTLDEVRAAFDRGELVRSWTMRGTLFATTPEHAHALRAQTAERVERASATRRVQLGLDAATLARADEVVRRVVGRAAADGVTRTELLEHWRGAGIAVDAQRGYHLIFLNAVRGLIHWGPFREGEQLLVATDERDAAPAPLAELARGYLRAHAPASADDLAWWLALPKTVVRAALAELAPEVVEVSVEGRIQLVLAEQLTDTATVGAPEVALVPGFDEWILGYRDRELVASEASLTAIVPGGNGIFRPTVLVDGRVVGTWRLAPRTREPLVELTEPVAASTRRAIDAAVAAWPH